MHDDLRYPIGPFTPVASSTTVIEEAITQIERLPPDLRQAVQGLSDQQLDTPYRPDGWTVRQVVHHVADSHMNGLIRLKLALTEDTPTIKPYDEGAWALLPDMNLPVDTSLRLIDQVHTRWVAVLRGLTPGQWERAFVHPEHNRTISLAEHTQNYAWHSRHHVAHISGLRHRQGW